MSIDVFHEQTCSLSSATNLIPRRRRGRKAAVSTLYRWATVGVRGIRLETIQVGGTRCTSVEALQRFFDALSTNPQIQGCEKPPAVKSQLLKHADQSLDRCWKEGCRKEHRSSTAN